MFKRIKKTYANKKCINYPYFSKMSLGIYGLVHVRVTQGFVSVSCQFLQHPRRECFLLADGSLRAGRLHGKQCAQVIYPAFLLTTVRVETVCCTG